MFANPFKNDVIKKLSHGFYPIGPMGNAMRAVPSHGTFSMVLPWGNPISMDKPVYCVLDYVLHFALPFVYFDIGCVNIYSTCNELFMPE